MWDWVCVGVIVIGLEGIEDRGNIYILKCISEQYLQENE
jgi:hypothetical protein